MITFTSAIAAHIEANYADGQSFNNHNLTDIAEAYGKPINSITHVLRKMATRGALKIVGERKNISGGTATKVYAWIPGTQLVPPADYRKRCHANYLKSAEDKFEHMNQCGIHLHEVLNAMTRARLAA